jgi:hypothetical protein
MDGTKKAVFGIFATQVEVERAVDLLIAADFPGTSISVLTPDTRSTRELAHEKHTKAPEGTTAGAAVGGLLGGTFGVLVGVGVLAIPGIGPLIAAGPIVAGLAGLGAGGAVGGLVGALAGMGIPEYEAKSYEGRIKGGGSLLSVHCDSAEQVDRARHLLAGAGATDVSTAREHEGDDDSDAVSRRARHRDEADIPASPVRRSPDSPRHERR